MTTILDNRRAELDAHILLMQEEIEDIRSEGYRKIQAITADMLVQVEKREAQLCRWQEQRHELEDYEPAINPDSSEE